MNDLNDIISLFDRRGDSQYGGEQVSQLEHALQTAQLAEQSDASCALISAALLHDVGHLLHQLADDAPDHGVDDHHENSGCVYLRQIFPKSVVEPVRLHVSAKRYLCTVDPTYFQQLSEPSVTSLRLQGGEMSPQEIEQFEANRHYAAALDLRRWDDSAKIPNKLTPSIDHFVRYLSESMIQS